MTPPKLVGTVGTIRVGIDIADGTIELGDTWGNVRMVGLDVDKLDELVALLTAARDEIESAR